MTDSGIMVTGGLGFIGSALIESLGKDCDTTIACLDTHPSLYDIQRAPADYFKKSDIVFHLASRQPSVMELNEDPLMGAGDLVDTEILLNKMRLNDVPKIVYTSSSVVYGQPYEHDIPTKESHTLNPISVYGGVKAGIEMLIRGFCHAYGIKFVILRLANIVGPNARRGIVYDIVEKLSTNKEHLTIIGSGRQTKSYLYIDDCVRMIKNAAESKFTNPTYNIGNFDAITVYEVVERICNLMNVNPVRSHKPNWHGDVQHMHLDMMQAWHLFHDHSPLDSAEAVEKTATEMLKKKGLIAAQP